MDVEIYYKILENRGENPQQLDKSKRPYLEIGELAFRLDCFAEKANWTNNRYQDWKYWIKTYHPLFSTCTAPAKHPYTRRRRVITLISMLCLGAMWATLNAYYAKKYDASFIKQYEWRILMSVCNGVILNLMEISMRKLSQCFCGENTNNCCWRCCKCCRKIGLNLWMFVGIAGLCVALLFLFIRNLWFLFITIYPFQFFFAWLFQIFGLTAKFWKKWNDDCENWKIHDYKYEISFIEYTQWASANHRLTNKSGLSRITPAAVLMDEYEEESMSRDNFYNPPGKKKNFKEKFIRK